MTDSGRMSLLDSIGSQTHTLRMKTYIMTQKNNLLARLHEQEQEIAALKTSLPTGISDQTENGFRMFSRGVRNMMDVYFPMMMDDSYFEIALESEIRSKVEQFISTIDKNWNELYRQLVKSKQAPGEDSTLPSRTVSKEQRKGKNCKIPVNSSCALQKWLLENFNDPYPSYSKKLELAKQARLSIRQVSNWFINARERIVKRFYRKDGIKDKGRQSRDSQCSPKDSNSLPHCD